MDILYRWHFDACNIDALFLMPVLATGGHHGHASGMFSLQVLRDALARLQFKLVYK